MLEILRIFGVATPDNVPRNVEHLSSTHPDELSTIFSFDFLRKKFLVIVDQELDDNKQLILGAAQQFNPNQPWEVLQNPGDDIADFATRFHGKLTYLVHEKKTSQRLDVFLAEKYPETSRSTWQKLIKAGKVTVNNEVVVSPKADITGTEAIEFSGLERPDFSDHQLPVIYEDSNVIVINKPAGILTHTKGALNDEFTVADFFGRVSKVGVGTNRPGVIHRLDRDTSGVILGAKTDEAAKKLKKQFSERTVKKTYIAILEHAPEPAKGIIDVPIGRNPASPSTFRADSNGKPAQTYYEVLAVAPDGRALVKFQPRTGRTHQLRVHAAFIKSPIVGDRVYGKPGQRLYLHAYQLEVTLPGGERKVFTAPIPAEFLSDFPGVKL